MELAPPAQRCGAGEAIGVGRSMQSRDPSGEEIRDSRPAEPRVAAENPETAAIDSLPASLLVKVLARRATQFARNRAIDIGSAVSRLRSKIKLRRPANGAVFDTVARRIRPRRGLAIAALILTIPAAYLAYCIATIPFAGGTPVQTAPSAMVFDGENGEPFATRGIIKGQPITAEHLPPLLTKAAIAIEDRRFYQHGGIDLRAIFRAALNDATGHYLQGASTITQQLARRLYLTPERTLKRKVQEAVLAEWLDLRYSKN